MFFYFVDILIGQTVISYFMRKELSAVLKMLDPGCMRRSISIFPYTATKPSYYFMCLFRQH